MTSMKQITKALVGNIALASLLLCIFSSNASQPTPAVAPNQNQQPTTQSPTGSVPVTTVSTTGQIDQTQQSTSQQTPTGVMPDQGQPSVPLAAQPVPPATTIPMTPPATIDTMATPQTNTSAPTMPQAPATQPTATTTPAEGQISAALAPGQSTPPAAPPVMPGQAMPTATSTLGPTTPQSTGALGLSMTNPTQYPITITLHIVPSNRVVQKDIPAGQTVDLLNEPLSKNDTYTVSGSLFQTLITKTTVTTLSGPAQQTQPAQFINTKTNRISSTKNWSAANPADQKIHLTVDFVERPGGEPTFEIRQQ